MSNNNLLVTVAPLVLLLVVMYFLLIRPQKKREKEVNAMRSNINVGDEIITIGGICGKVVKTKDDSLVIQVGAGKTKFEVMRWSISKVVESARMPSADEEEEDIEETPKKALPKRMKKAESKTDDTESSAAEKATEEIEK